jgi:predicted glycogen debranching enzyme
MGYRLGKSLLSDPDKGLQYEWLESNGVGGWASSTVLGAHTRRYHGLLVTATRPPVGRMVLLSKLDETLHISGKSFPLGCSVYHNTIHPEGYRHLDSFEKDLFPVFTYKAGGVTLRKTVAGVWGQNTTVVLYDVLEAPGVLDLELRPFVASRDYHHLMQANNAVRTGGEFRSSLFRAQPYDGGPRLFLRIPGASFRPQPDWYYRFEYAREAERGLDCHEDLFTYGTFSVQARKGDRIEVTVATEEPSSASASELVCLERQRRERLLPEEGEEDDLVRTLTLAADQFVVKRSGDLRTILAGYHWFTDWGRDTMIALPGITLTTGREEDARMILESFADSVSEGMLPNRFPDAGERPDYNTVDATLWFFVAAYEYWRRTADREFVSDRLVPVMKEIVVWHDRGTRYGIHVGDDGLVSAGDPGVQLTWMDAKVGGWVVTPRHGKAVEINALWYNALMILSEFLRTQGDVRAARNVSRRAEDVKRVFDETFWNPAGSCLYDCVCEGVPDDAIRPNQIFALSLPFPLLPDDRALHVLEVVERDLLTPFGLRSLSPGHPAYRGHYGGDQVSRDGAYHQGTVWSWLLGPYVTALCRYRGDLGRSQAAGLFSGIRDHVGAACVGSVSEIFDGDPPHAPRGTVAQAWGVGECLRCYVEDLKGLGVGRPLI